jgi:hypothetical protein
MDKDKSPMMSTLNLDCYVHTSLSDIQEQEIEDAKEESDEEESDEEESEEEENEQEENEQVEYDRIRGMIEQCYEENGESCYNRRKDSPRSKANYYSNLADTIDYYQYQLNQLRNKINNRN